MQVEYWRSSARKGTIFVTIGIDQFLKKKKRILHTKMKKKKWPKAKVWGNGTRLVYSFMTNHGYQCKYDYCVYMTFFEN